jgi:hypothetical protein
MLRLMDYLIIFLVGLMVVLSLYIEISFYRFNGDMLALLNLYDICFVSLIITYCAKSLLQNDDDDFDGGKRYPLFKKVGIAYANAFMFLVAIIEIPILVFNNTGISLAQAMSSLYWGFVALAILYFLYQITRKNKKKF